MILPPHLETGSKLSRKDGHESDEKATQTNEPRGNLEGGVLGSIRNDTKTTGESPRLRRQSRQQAGERSYFCDGGDGAETRRNFQNHAGVLVERSEGGGPLSGRQAAQKATQTPSQSELK